MPITNIDLPVTGPFPLAGDQIARQKFPIADLPSSAAPFPPICADVRTTHIVGCNDSFHGKLGIVIMEGVAQDNLSDTQD